jgi:hypothetical protein
VRGSAKKKRKEGFIMKKILFMVLAVTVLAVPAWAVINITATTTQVTVNGTPADTDEVVITYENTEPNAVRAFAFDITVQDPCGDPNADAHIIDINEGDLNVDYWVYPGSIDINEAGAVNDVGTPVADPCQLPSDTQGGLGTAGITVEMGSLYVGEVNAPASSGVLLKLYVDDNCLVNMADNVSRGAIVLEGVGSKASGNYTGGSVNMYTGTQLAQWRAVGKPKCWCRYQGGRQCKGDADGRSQMKANYWVYTNDLDVLIAGWMKPYSDMVNPDGSHKTASVGVPAKNVAWVCADFDQITQMKPNYRVYTLDLDILIANWMQGALPNPTCP